MANLDDTSSAFFDLGAIPSGNSIRQGATILKLLRIIYDWLVRLYAEHKIRCYISINWSGETRAYPGLMLQEIQLEKRKELACLTTS